jgi:periplasmic divalent cation tolerance protein
MEKDSTQYGVVMVTAASRLEAETIAKALLEAKLAACITLLPVQSIYTWQGKVEQNEE